MVALVMAGLVVLTAALTAGLRRIVVSDDEAWFLQVIVRCSRGEALYRDVFYGAGPLPVWIGQLVVRGRRRKMLALRVLAVVYFVALLVAGSWVLGEAGAPTPAVAALWIGTLAFAPPTTVLENHYTRLALLGAVVAVGATLEIAPSGPASAFALAGVAAGVSFSSKQTIGIAATAGAGAVALDAGGIDAAACCVMASVLVSVACLAPLARAGTLGWYVRRSFLNKTSYLATGSMSLLDGIREGLRRGFDSRAQAVAYAAVLFAAYLVVPAVVVVCAGAVRALVAGHETASASLTDTATVALGAITLATAIPRANFYRIRGLLPVGLLTIALAVSAHPEAVRSVPAPARVAATAVLLVVTVLALAISLRRIQVGPSLTGPVDRNAPYFEGLPVLRLTSPSARVDGEGLRERTGGRVFLLRPDAPVWYLTRGLENPTPYDYPFASVFGPSGQQDVIEDIRSGRITWVCSPGPTTGRLRPAALEDFVASSMVAADETLAGVLYRLAPDSSAASSEPGPNAPRS